jgi:hypothetical protein
VLLPIRCQIVERQSSTARPQVWSRAAGDGSCAASSAATIR